MNEVRGIKQEHKQTEMDTGRWMIRPTSKSNAKQNKERKKKGKKGKKVL